MPNIQTPIPGRSDPVDWDLLRRVVEDDTPLEPEDMTKVWDDVFLTTIVVPMLDNMARFWFAEAEQILINYPQDIPENAPERAQATMKHKACMYNVVVLHKAMALCEEWRG